ncbi:MAG: hypothetical protein WA628_22890 [Terriglobales bacterium]
MLNFPCRPSHLSVLLLIFVAMASAQPGAKASMIAPAPGSTLDASTVTFAWTSASAASEYRLDVGTALGASDIFGSSSRLSTNCSVNSLPTDGSTVYVRLSTLINGTWEYNDYGYTASTNSTGPAVSRASMLSPAPGTRLSTATATFTWTAGLGAQAYQLDVGTTQGGGDIFRQSAGLATSQTVTSLPTDCRTVYVRLSTKLNGAWQYNDYTYSSCDRAPVHVTGAPGSAASPCGCGDVSSLRHRLEEVMALKAGLEAKLQAASPNDLATRDAWLALQNEVRGRLPQLSYAAPATSATIAMFNNYVDPLCGSQSASVGTCLDQSTAAHQQVHDVSCRAGQWNGQQSWSMRSMIKEEIAANQAEMDYLQLEVRRLSCACSSPFALVVQVVTASAASMPGITEQSARSLNGQQGILVPITLHDDRTFEGQGSGTDSGTAAAYAAGGHAQSQFGHMQSIQASGVITPGDCSTQPCRPDMMHLVLAGVAGPQSSEAQARFPGYSRNMSQVTPGGAGVVQFDFPAYVGQGKQRVLLDMGIMKSTMNVTIVSGEDASSQGASLLYSLQCRSTSDGTQPQAVTAGSLSNGLTINGGGSAGLVGLTGQTSPAIALTIQSGSGATTSWVNVKATDSLTGAIITGTVMIDGPNGLVTGPTGTKLTFPNCYAVTGTGSTEQKSVSSCSGKVTASGYSQVIFSAP